MLCLLSNVAVSFRQSGLGRIFAEVDSKLEQGRRRVIAGGLLAGALLASQAQALQLTVAWDNSSSGATGFQVERSADGTNFAQVASVASSSTSYTDTTLTSGSSWYRPNRSPSSPAKMRSGRR